MKVALCFNGQPRDVKQCYKSMLNNLIIPNFIEDIFVHTWWRPEFEYFGHTVGNDTHHGTIIPKDVLKFILYAYKPKKILIENDLEKQFHPIESIVSAKIGLALKERLFPMFYSRKQCNIIKNDYCKEHNIQYDAIIFTRFDNYIVSPIKIDKFDLTAVNTTQYLNEKTDPGRTNDVIMISNEKNTNIFAQLYDNLPLISSHLDYFIGETILYKWFELNDIKFIESMNYPNDVVIYRTIQSMRNCIRGTKLDLIFL